MNTLAFLLASAFTVWWVDPYGVRPYLPDAEPAGGIVTNILGCAAARGEIETISFSVRPDRDMTKVDFVPSDLTGPDGAKIPASAADFALVKCWYRAAGRWETSWAGNTGKPTLINDLVIHDNDLIRVVEAEKYEDRTILLRFSYPDGPVWIDMRKHGRGDDHFKHELHPVMDAKTFVPFDLKKGRFQQYWFTWKVPADAKPGLYRGTLAVKEDGKPLDSLKVELEVYPFALPTARTHYDTSRRFILAWFGTPNIAKEIAHSKDLAVAERKVFNIYKSFAEHNSNEPAGPGAFAENSTDDLAVRSLILMLRAGMDCNTLLSGDSFGDMTALPIDKGSDLAKAESLKTYAAELKRFEKSLELQRTVFDKYLGHHNNYFCGPDECKTEAHRRLYGFYSSVHRMDMDTWGDGAVAADVGWSLGMNDVAAAARHTIAWAWHNSAARAVTYAGTFTGPSCPDIWRRTKGLRYYYNDFDGIHEYVLYYNRWNHWNDFKWRGNYTQMQIVYPVYDGIIPTLAWEGVREAMDDVRYLSLLRLRAEAAMKSSDPKVRAAGKRQFVWMDLQDPERIIDLFAFRREVARRCIELIGLVGPEPDEKPRRPAPELPPCTYGQNVPAGSSRAKLAEEYVRNNRYDLAIPMWGRQMDDAGLKVSERVEAAMAKADLEGAILRRADALKTIDKALAWEEINQIQRGQLLLLRVRTMVRDRNFEEEFTAEQLSAAAKVFDRSIACPGVSSRERYDTVVALADAYRAGQQHQALIGFIDARLADLQLTGQEKCNLLVKKGFAYSALMNWDESAKMFRFAHEAGVCNSHEVLNAEGFVAEKRSDWKTAQRCYGDQVKTYGPEEYDLKAACIARLNYVTKKLNESEKGKTVDMDATMNGSETISLEE